MFPVDWLALVIFLMPLVIGVLGQGDLRKSDIRLLLQVQMRLWIPSLWTLVSGWIVTFLLAGVAGYFFWRDLSGFRLYDSALATYWFGILSIFVWMRLLKMQDYDLVAAFVCFFGVMGCGLATLVMFGVAGTETGSWIPFGVYFVPFLVFAVCAIWNFRLAFDEEYKKEVATRRAANPKARGELDILTGGTSAMAQVQNSYVGAPAPAPKFSSNGTMIGGKIDPRSLKMA